MSRFKSGKSGNPKGRPVGGPDRRREFRELIRDAVPELIEKALELARGGDAASVRLLLDRALPPMKAQAEPAPFVLPKDGSLSDIGRAILASVAVGEMSPDAGKGLLDALAAQSRLLETDDILRRVEALEQRKENNNGG
jgi:hypothetical protein